MSLDGSLRPQAKRSGRRVKRLRGKMLKVYHKAFKPEQILSS
jgi:hypothetical protein